MGLVYEAKLDAFYLKWRKRNPHNDTGVRCMFPMDRVSVGNKTYGDLYVLAFNPVNQLRIGHYVSIGPEVAFVLSADHYLDHVSTYPFRTKVIRGESEGVSKGDIVVEDDAWIGYGATVLSGVHIGQGAVIAAGAVVTGDIPPYAVAAGVPARVIRYRFSQEIIRILLTLDYGHLEEDMVKAHEEALYTSLENLTAEEVERLYAWFPKRKPR